MENLIRWRLRVIKALGVILLLALWTLGSVSDSQAEGGFIAAPNRVDMVHDSQRNILYITSGSQVLRYNLKTKSFLSSFQLGGKLMGIDLSPDGDTLAVADDSIANGQLWIHLVNLRNNSIRKVTFLLGSWEGGSFSVAFGRDGNILITSQFQGSGWVPLRRYNPANGKTDALLTITQNSMLTSSADGAVIAFAESNIGDGSWGRYRVSDGNIVKRTGYTDGTGWFNYEIGTNRNGTQFAIPTYGGTFIYNAGFSLIKTLGQYAGPQPIGVVYHPCRDVVFFAWANSEQVYAFETVNFSQSAKYNFEYTFQHTGNQAYTQGRLKISRDGLWLFATVDGGVRYVSLPDSLSCIAPIEVPEANTIFLVASGIAGIATWLGIRLRRERKN